MPPASRFRTLRRRLLERFVRAACVLAALLALPGLAMAWGSTMDPVFVFYPRGFCSGDRIALEVWNRDEQRWVEHPRHPVVRLDSCQLEDAGVLLNEIRWQCVEANRSERGPLWNVGVRVFDSDIMQHCGIARTGSGFGDTEIHVSTPKPGETISDADGNLEIEGSVWIGGLPGSEYDVVIAIDTSQPASDASDAQPHTADAIRPATPQPQPDDPLSAQVRAARHFVDSIRGRLGDVRVGIVSFPGLDPKPARGSSAAATRAGGSRAARRELPLTSNATAIDRALRRVVERGHAGPMSFGAGLELALDELQRPPDWPGAARPGARRVVVLAADGRGGFPFGQGAQADRDFRERSVELAQRASQRGVALHLFALGGISEAPPAFVDEMLAGSAGSFERLQPTDLDTALLARVRLPYLEDLSIHAAADDAQLGELSVRPDGRFAASVPLVPGANSLILRARTSDGSERESRLAVEFDASAYQARLLAQEAERIRRARSKQLVLEVER